MYSIQRTNLYLYNFQCIFFSPVQCTAYNFTSAQCTVYNFTSAQYKVYKFTLAQCTAYNFTAVQLQRTTLTCTMYIVLFYICTVSNVQLYTLQCTAYNITTVHPLKLVFTIFQGVGDKHQIHCTVTPLSLNLYYLFSPTYC